MPTSPKVLAICVNWNGGQLLRETLAALQMSEYPSLQILVVDSASTDDSLDHLSTMIQLLRLTENRGYAAALNRAIEHACANLDFDFSYLLLINNDLRLAPDCLSQLVAAGEQRRPSICGPRVLQWRHPDRLEASWGELQWHHVLARFRDQNAPDSQPVTTREVELLLGCALLVSRDAAEQIGAWDEAFFLYHEEVDYLHRASQLGIPVFYIPAAKAYHWGGWGTPDSLRKVYWVRRNTIYFFRKHGASGWHWARWGGSLAASLLWNLLTLRGRRVSAICRGVIGGFRMEPVGE